VKITFEEPEHGKTFLVLEQSNIPSSDVAGNDTYESVEHGWRNLICQQIKKVFGFGY
jgi:activator of HSP90 ATPase